MFHKWQSKRGFYGYALVILALILIIPQYVSKSMIVGSDIVFHFNRFYDVSQQIEHQNFQYFINLYGFQQSGRIVNALYGPLMAYFHGLLVWLSPSWYAYQMLANFILFALSGNCMYFLLRKCSVEKRRSFYLSIVYMTSFSIVYWVSRQGFTSWGAAVFPLCLLPMVDLFEKHRFPPLKVGLLMALMFQIHLFSSVLLFFIYFSCFLFIFIKEKAVRKRLVLQGFVSVLFFFCLTLNIWYSLWTLYQGNDLLAPFINHTMYKNTVTARSIYWLVTPGILLLFLLFFLREISQNWKKLPDFDRVIGGVALFFLILSTNLIPWRFLEKQHWGVIETIQFPFRFFVPFTVLLLVFVARNGRFIWKGKNQLLPFLKLAALVSIIQLVMTMGLSYYHWQTAEKPIVASRHTHLYSEEMDEITASFFKSDKSEMLALIQKSTPDYLPIYEENQLNKYNQYKILVIDQNESGKFKKKVKGNRLSITWQAEEGEEVHLPVIVYRKTEVVYNQEALSHETLELTDIGTPVLNSQAGENTLEIYYPQTRSFVFSLIIPIATLVLTALGLFWKKIKAEVSS